MKTGLVLEGGAMRGMYTAGVLDVLMENDIHFDGIIGASAGAVFGVNYLSKQNGRVIRYNCRFNRDRNYMGIKCLLRTGDFFNTEYAYYRVPKELDIFDDETYKASGVPFYAVVTDVKTGQPVYMKVESVLRDMEILRASASMPFASKPVIIDHRAYLDGGVSDSIPFEKFSEMGYTKQVVILTRDMTYRKKPMNKLLIKSFYGKYPEFCDSLQNRHAVYNDSVEKLVKLEEKGEAFVIRPSEPITISRTERDPEKLRQVYELGRKDAENRLNELKQFMLQEGNSTTVYLVRHAQPNYDNHNDEERELTEKGMKDRQLVTKYLSDKNIDVVLSSPYKRAIDTVKDFADKNLLDIKIIPDLRERKIDSCWIEDFKSFAMRQWEDFDFKLSDGESLNEVQTRLIAALTDILQTYKGKNIAIGGHGTAISTIINYYDRSFGYEGFESIRCLLPFIAKLTFIEDKCTGIEIIDLFKEKEDGILFDNPSVLRR